MYLNKYCGMMAILAISEQHIKLLEKSSVFFLLVGQSSHSLHVLVHTHTHTSQTHNYIRTSVCSSFSQEGRICCQHTILLPLLSSPAYLCGMLLKMINCYFLICPLQDFFCLTAFNGPTRPEITNTHMQGCTRYQAKAIASGAVVGSPASDQAVRLDLARTPVPLSSTITSQEKKGQGWRSGKNSKPVEEIQSNIWMHYFVVLFSFRIGLVFVSFSSKCKSCNVATKSNTNLEEKCVFSFS